MLHTCTYCCWWSSDKYRVGSGGARLALVIRTDHATHGWRHLVRARPQNDSHICRLPDHHHGSLVLEARIPYVGSIPRFGSIGSRHSPGNPRRHYSPVPASHGHLRESRHSCPDILRHCLVSILVHVEMVDGKPAD